jgi:hypothetical protein
MLAKIQGCFRHRWEYTLPVVNDWGNFPVLVPASASRSVVFIGSVDDEGVFTPRATGFLVNAVELRPESIAYPYLVTAEHVISGMLTRDMDIHCRVNRRDGVGEVIKLPPDRWWFHPDEHQRTDVAVLPMGMPQDLLDHEYIPVVNMPRHEDRRPRLGEEVFILGLFRSHYGKQRNVPIVRIGNISALPEEPVWTKYCGHTDAYLIEARSISGLSGSPVFKNAEGLMPFPKQPTDASLSDVERIMNERRAREEIDWLDWEFVGLVHGHFDVSSLDEDMVTEDSPGSSAGINTGIGIVIPADKIKQTLFQPDLKEERKAMVEKAKDTHGATPDLDLSDASEQEPHAKADNPQHKEDFNRLLNAATSDRKEGSET